MKGFINYLVRQSIFGNLVTVGIVLAGIFSITSMKREAFPNVDFDVVVVTTIYPGASPEEVEKLITIPIERELKPVDGIKKNNSTSLEARSSVVLTLEADIENKIQVVQDIRDAVSRAKLEFPDDAEEPLVSEITTQRTPIIEISISSSPAVTGKPALNEYEMRQIAEQLSDELETISEVALVDKRGYRDREIKIEVDPAKLLRYNISVDEIAQKLSSRNLNYPGGTITEGGKEYVIRTVKEFSSASEVETINLRSNDLGNRVLLRDVANVRDDFEDLTIMEKANGERSIVLTVLKREQGDAIRLVDSVKELVKEFQKQAPEQLQVAYINDISFYIRRRLNVLISNVSIGLLLVSFSLLFFLGWRVSLMVALGIPFSFAITFIVMDSGDISINLISMFGLIIVSGMIVDDAIVVGENIFRRIEHGEAPMVAAVRGASEMIAPVTASVSTTMIAFAPLMFMSGVFGKFVWPIAAAVIIALAASLIESFFILPAHIADATKNQDHSSLQEGDRLETKVMNFFQKLYVPILKAAIDKPYRTMVLLLILLLTSFSLMPKIGFILFPKGGIEIFLIKAEATQGVSLEEMDRRMKPYEDAISALPDNEVDDFVSRIGIHQEEANDAFVRRGKNYAQATIYLSPERERERSASEIIRFLQRKTDFNNPVKFASSLEGKGFVSITNKPVIEVFETSQKRRILQRLKLDTEFVAGATYREESSILAIITAENRVINWDVKEGKLQDAGKMDLDVSDGVAFMQAWSNDEVIILSDKSVMYALDLNSAELTRLTSIKFKVTSLSVNQSAGEIYVTTDKGSLLSFSYRDKSIESKLDINQAPFMETADNKVRFLDDFLFKIPRVEYAFPVETRELALACADGTIRIVNLDTGLFSRSFRVTEKSVYWGISVKDGFWTSSISDLIFTDKQGNRIKSIPIKGSINQVIYDNNTIKLMGSNSMVMELTGSQVKVINAGSSTLEKVEYKMAGGGPPVGAPVQIELRGNEFKTLLEIAEKVKEQLFTIEGVYDIRDNWEEGKEEYRTNVNERIADLAGVSVLQIASTVQTAFEGRVPTSIKKSNEEIDIRIIYPEKMRNELNTLNEVMVRNNFGNLIPITRLASFERTPGIAQITHKNGRRVIYVRANLDEQKTSSVDVNRAMENLLGPIIKEYPGYSFRSGGEYEDTQESLSGLGKAAVIAILGISGILVLLYGNLRHPRVVLAVIPFGLIGVLIVFYLHKLTIMPQLTFSFLATMGIIGLTGVVVNDSIVLVDFANRLRKAGLSTKEAIFEAGLYRLRPVLLTTITTVLGLLPTAYGLGGDDPFLKPMALALAWGLLFATGVTLIIIPIYYSIWDDRGYIFRMTFNQRFLTKKGEK